MILPAIDASIWRSRRKVSDRAARAGRLRRSIAARASLLELNRLAPSVAGQRSPVLAAALGDLQTRLETNAACSAAIDRGARGLEHHHAGDPRQPVRRTYSDRYWDDQ